MDKPLNENRFILGLRLKERREAKRLSQTELAKLVGTDKGTINRIERGRQTTNSIRLLMNLASVLECSGYYLLGMRDDTGPAFIVNERQLELLTYFNRLDERGQLVSIGILREAVSVFESLKKKTANCD